MIDIVEIPVDESMSGTLWLFPCAVCLPHLASFTAEGLGRGIDPCRSTSTSLEQYAPYQSRSTRSTDRLGSGTRAIGFPRYRFQEGNVGWE
jgi:hypothetical protein